MILRFFKYIFPKEQPDWFRGLNMILMLPILAWPFVLFLSIFMFDNPFQDHRKTFLQFLAVIAYPVYLVLLALLNSRLFTRNKILGTISTAAVLLAILLGVAYILYGKR
jgi:fructose-specific phosphotransferase system IIC component